MVPTEREGGRLTPPSLTTIAHYYPNDPLAAVELLYSHLSLVQRAQLTTHGWFYVTGSGTRIRHLHPGTYLITAYDPTPFRILGEGYPVRPLLPSSLLQRYCIHPRAADGLPIADVHLAHKLMIETDESGWLRTAHNHGLAIVSDVMHRLATARLR